MNFASSFANDVRTAYAQRRAQRTASQIAAEQRAAREQAAAERRAFWRDVVKIAAGLAFTTLMTTGVVLSLWVAAIHYFFGG